MPQFDANINVYEKGSIGGRLRTIKVANHDYEAGGSVIHSRNKYMVDFAKMLGAFISLQTASISFTVHAMFSRVSFLRVDVRSDFRRNVWTVQRQGVCVQGK